MLRRLFDLIDVDGDNEVSKREVLQAVRTDGRGNHLVRALVEQSSANIQVCERESARAMGNKTGL